MQAIQTRILENHSTNHNDRTDQYKNQHRMTMPSILIRNKYRPLIDKALNLFQEFNAIVDTWGKTVSLQAIMEDFAKLNSYRIPKQAEHIFLDLYELIKEIQIIIQSEYLPLLNDNQFIDQDQALLEVQGKIWSKYFIIASTIQDLQLPSHHFDESDKDCIEIKYFQMKIDALFGEIFNMYDNLRNVYDEVKAGKDEHNTSDAYILIKLLYDLEQAHKNISDLILRYPNEVSLFNSDLTTFFTIYMQKEYIDILRIIQDSQQSFADNALKKMYAQAREKKKDTNLEKQIHDFIRADKHCKNLYSNLKTQMDQVISREEKHGISDVIQIQINAASQNPPPYNPEVVPPASKSSLLHIIKSLNLPHDNFKSTLLEAKNSVMLQADENINMNPYQRFLIRRALQLQAEFVECKEYYRKHNNDPNSYAKNNQLITDNHYYKSQLWDLYKYFVPEISLFSSNIIPEKEVVLIVENDMNNDLDPTLVTVTHNSSNNVNFAVNAVDPEMKSDDIFALAIRLVEGYIKESTSKGPMHVSGKNLKLKNAMKAYADAMKDLVKDKNVRTKYNRYPDDSSWSEKWAHSKLVSKMKEYIHENGIEGLHGKVVYARKPGIFSDKYTEKEGAPSQYSDIDSKLKNTNRCCSIM